MKKNNTKDTDELRPEYDFRGGERGKYAKRFAEGNNLVAIDPDVLERFPDSRSINEALRTLILLGRKLPKAPSRNKAKR